MNNLKRTLVIPLPYVNSNLALDNELMIDLNNNDILIKSRYQ